MYTGQTPYFRLKVGFLSIFYSFYLKRVPNHWFKGRIEFFLGNLFFPSGTMELISETPKIRLFAKNNDVISNYMIKNGLYERDSLSKVIDIFKSEDGIFLDVGSNIGLYTCCLSSLGCKSIAIEASYKAMLFLEKNININGLQDYVRLYNVAVSDQKTFFSFNTESHNNNLGTGTLVNGHDKEDFYKLLTCTISDILINASNFISEKKILLMKLDVEGHELNVLKSIEFTKKFRPKYILMEYFHNSTLSKEALKFLSDNEYRYTDIYGREISELELVPENNLLFISKT